MNPPSSSFFSPCPFSRPSLLSCFFVPLPSLSLCLCLPYHSSPLIPSCAISSLILWSCTRFLSKEVSFPQVLGGRGMLPANAHVWNLMGTVPVFFSTKRPARIFEKNLEISFAGCRGPFWPVWNNIQCVWTLNCFWGSLIIQNCGSKTFSDFFLWKTGKCFDVTGH